MTPRVTVCIPTVGRMRYLPATRASLASQTYADYEALVLDNATDGEARRFIEDWANGDRRIRVLRSDARIPMFQNFNRGIRAAAAPYVAFFHDDDEYPASFLERHVAMLEREPSVGFCGSNYDYIDADGRLLEKRRWIPRTEVWAGRRYIRALARRGRNLVGMPGLLFRREVLGDGFDEGISVHFGDFVILMRIAETWDVGLIHDSLLRIRRHETQASQAMPRAETLALRASQLRAYCDEFEARWPQERAFVDEMRRAIEVTHKLSLLGYWLVSETTTDAEACLHELLGGTSLERTLAPALVRMDWMRRHVSRSRSAISALSRLAGGLGL